MIYELNFYISQIKDLLDRWSALRERETSQAAQISGDLSQSKQPMSHRLNFDMHFPAPDDNDGSFLFFGSSSVYVLSIELLAIACPESTMLRPPENVSGRDNGIQQPSVQSLDNVSLRVIPSKVDILKLFDTYQESCMIFWPFPIESVSDDDIATFLQSTQEATSDSGPPTRVGAYSNFLIAMICSISAAHSSRTISTMGAYEDFFYRCALKLMKEVLSEATHESLRGLMMIIIYLLFRPQRGDLWMLLQSACRLAVELGYHRQDAPFSEDFDQRSWRSYTFWSLYRLEHTVAEVYGRPSDDLESISTIELPPMALPSFDMKRLSTLTGTTFVALVGLSRIRSEIFKTLYLPASASPLGLEDPFYLAKLRQIEKWCQKTMGGVKDRFSDVVFRIAYHSAMIFLFQKSLLRVISSIGESPINQQRMASSVAVQSFKSAGHLIDIYETLILSDEGQGLSNYPVTFVSAHEIYAAGLTLMAHCICLLDGRVGRIEFPIHSSQPLLQATSSPLHQSFFTHEETGRIHALSATCLSLLTWCAIQWPGMSGMVEIYREVSATTLPMMARQGLA
ncbi:uncharacterized protein Z518_06593 [Rhinocladiella mackenziei CBS 650.93]|uniref:Xylanolytic transcriptional activator regulatory domain-containing protein n=1 Tax=Rhinocladiella mackenziei CBS 650.93 TaxID=1442369 RepID=A0A0D2GXZ3_9EURO|nr:uncharacterized protein Z518_06593 [Rhinocladiella mackenziei CBS 650.93]KIX03043.1 hypothetical protein Z518_06593 [Rhinocladiella mackenziei CBS 650.93]